MSGSVSASMVEEFMRRGYNLPNRAAADFARAHMRESEHERPGAQETS